jgi:hypothetical protein
MATFATIRPRLPLSQPEYYQFILEYNARREFDMQKPNMYVKKARAAKEKTATAQEKNKKISVSLAQLQMLRQLGLA